MGSKQAQRHDPCPAKTSSRRRALLIAALNHRIVIGREAAFACGYCHRKFFSGKALGGHQNAHRLERAPTMRQLVIPSSSSSSPAPTFHCWIHAGGDLLAAAAAAAPVLVDYTWTSEWAGVGAAAAPEVVLELDLSLKL